jgi:release factor glutamine methyltransferase
MVVSNPPYIPESERPGLQREVRDFEPHTALFAGHDGLDIVRRLLSDAPEYLEQNGFLLFEIGFGQSTQVVDLIDKNVWQLIEIRPDLQGIPRMVVLQCL